MYLCLKLLFLPYGTWKATVRSNNNKSFDGITMHKNISYDITVEEDGTEVYKMKVLYSTEI